MRRPPYREWTRLMFDCDYPQIPDSPQFVRFLIHCLRNHPDKRMRYICAHHARLKSNERLRSAIIARASDLGEHPTVRGECLESFTMNWSRPWSRTDRKAHRTVIKCLRDSDPYVRFWACYAAANNKMHWVIPILESMKDDDEPAAMGETVGFEATEAIKALRIGYAWEDGFPSGLPPATSWENLHFNPYD